MLLSVVIPFHECNFLLHRAIESIYNQLVQETELILVGDGITQVIQQELQNFYPDLTVYILPKLGANSARTKGIASSKGAYILFVDSDDTLPNNALNEYLQIIKNHLVDLIISNVRRIEPNKPLRSFYHFKNANKVLFKDSLSLSQLYHLPVLINKCFRKDIMRNDKIKDCIMYQDVMITALLFKHSHTLYYTNTELYHYHKREGSTSSLQKITEENLIKTIKVLEEIENCYSAQILTPSDKKYLYLLIHRIYYTLIRRSFYLNKFPFSNKLRILFKQKKEYSTMGISVLYYKSLFITVLLSNSLLFRIYFYLRRTKNS